MDMSSLENSTEEHRFNPWLLTGDERTSLPISFFTESKSGEIEFKEMEFREMIPSNVPIPIPSYRSVWFGYDTSTPLLDQFVSRMVRSTGHDSLHRILNDGLDPNDIECVMTQANVSRARAMKELKKHKNIVDAILACDDSPSDFKLEIEKYAGGECVCSMCLDNIESGSDIHKLSCNHIFHARNCLGDKGIANWIEDHKTCPYCRAKIDTPKIDGEDGLDPEEIQIVMTQASCSRKDAVKSLKKHGNIVDAILEIIP